MRISDSMIASSLVARLSKASARLFELQAQVASGLAFTTPSQSPSGAVRATALRSNIAELSRYRVNCDDADARLSLTEVALARIADSLREARGAALAMSPYDHAVNRALADNVATIAAGIVGEVSAQSEGRHLFAGHRSLTPPLLQNPAGPPPYLYQGDRGDSVFQLGRAVTIVANLDAAEILNMDGAVDPARDDTLELLRQLESALASSDSAGVENCLREMQWHLDHVVALRGQTGARLQQVQLARGRLEDGVRILRTMLSDVQDVDITKAIMDLRSQEITYQAAAAAAAALNRASLCDYL